MVGVLTNHHRLPGLAFPPTITVCRGWRPRRTSPFAVVGVLANHSRMPSVAPFYLSNFLIFPLISLIIAVSKVI
jgi:hypothetical protein